MLRRRVKFDYAEQMVLHRMVTLRESRHELTRQAVVGAAFALFEQRAYPDVTMDDIAQAAGISRSTVYRRFPTKEDVVLEIPRRWLAVFAAAAESGIGLSDTVRRACLAVSAHVDANAAITLQGLRIAAEVPAIRAASIATDAWGELFTRVIRERSSLDVEGASVIAGAYLGALEVSLALWAQSNAAEPLVAATERLLGRFQPLLDDAEAATA